MRVGKSEEEKTEIKKVGKRLKRIALVAAVATVCAGLVILSVKVLIPNQIYQSAKEQIEAGNYGEAYEKLDSLDGYKDSAELQESIRFDYQMTLLQETEVGDSLYFGTYEQDNDLTNGKENIEWTVLAKEEGRVLVISRYALDSQKYTSPMADVTWETCLLREWMNETFLQEAFSPEEIAMIAETTVPADKNPDYDTDAGNDTLDQIFLLSITELEEYFPNGLDRQCKATAYAVAQGAYAYDPDFAMSQGAYVYDFSGTCWWWLRSPGYSSFAASSVNIDGSIDCNGDTVTHAGGSVRPVMWIEP